MVCEMFGLVRISDKGAAVPVSELTHEVGEFQAGSGKMPFVFDNLGKPDGVYSNGPFAILVGGIQLVDSVQHLIGRLGKFVTKDVNADFLFLVFGIGFAEANSPHDPWDRITLAVVLIGEYGTNDTLANNRPVREPLSPDRPHDEIAVGVEDLDCVDDRVDLEGLFNFVCNDLPDPARIGVTHTSRGVDDKDKMVARDRHSDRQGGFVLRNLDFPSPWHLELSPSDPHRRQAPFGHIRPL